MLDGEIEESELADAWAMLRDEMLPEHIAENPGTRPWAWWAFESKEPRRRVNDGPEAIGPATWFGTPSRFTAMPPAGMFESERDYLQRLGLLTDDERKALQTMERRSDGVTPALRRICDGAG
jgi:hypothetical protein